MGIETAIVASALLATATTAYSVDQSNKARADAKDQANQLRAEQDQQLKDAQDKALTDQAAKDQAITTGVTRARKSDAVTAPTFDTLGSAPTGSGSKTLLGS